MGRGASESNTSEVHHGIRCVPRSLGFHACWFWPGLSQPHTHFMAPSGGQRVWLAERSHLMPSCTSDVFVKRVNRTHLRCIVASREAAKPDQHKNSRHGSPSLSSQQQHTSWPLRVGRRVCVCCCCKYYMCVCVCGWLIWGRMSRVISREIRGASRPHVERRHRAIRGGCRR